MVGTRTSIAMTGDAPMRRSVSNPGRGREEPSLSDTRNTPTPGSARTCTTARHSAGTSGHSRVYRRIHDVDLFFGHHTVHDTERSDLLAIRLAGGHQQVVRLRPAGERDV